MTKERLPVVAIIGRPNVGKSTLFNRIAGQRRAIVHNHPGVTRDRIQLQVTWNDYPFLLVDTGGYVPGTLDDQVKMVTDQAGEAIKEADAVIFLLDAAAGLTPLDKEVAGILHRGGKRVFLAANKVDNPGREALTGEFNSLGFQPVYSISAEHALGISELVEAVVASIPEAVTTEESGPVPRVAVVGRPNVGKSTLINYFLGEERLITDDKPGTTRDAVDTTLRLGQREYLLIDTAGIRRRGKVQAPVEKYSVLRAHDAIRRSDLSLLLLDSREMVTDQDARIAGLIKESGKGCLILVNKWDLVRDLDRKAARNLIRETMPFIDYAPVMFISALKGKGAGGIFPQVDEIYRELTRTISTNVLNRFLAEATEAHKPASRKGRPVTFSYITQVRVNPPTFTILANHPSRVHLTYRRYLVNRLREEFGFEGVSIVMRFRQKKGKPRRRS